MGRHDTTHDESDGRRDDGRRWWGGPLDRSIFLSILSTMHQLLLVIMLLSCSCRSLKLLALRRPLLQSSSSRCCRSLTATAITDGDADVYGVTRNVLAARVRAALVTAFGDDGKDADTMLVPAKPEFGDFQCNAALPLAKKLKAKPKELAERLMAALAVQDVVASMDISGPGFINLHLSDAYLQDKLAAMLRDPQRLGIRPAAPRQRVVVDFSSPNIAKVGVGPSGSGGVCRHPGTLTAPTSPRRCTSATCAPPSSVILSVGG